MPKTMKITCVLLLSAFIYQSCGSGRLYDDVLKIPYTGWDKSDIKTFTFSVNDTSEAYDIMLHLRNKTSYENSNLWLFVTTEAPNGNSIKDTLQFILADRTGKWLGSGLGSINSMLIPFKMNIRFPYRGIYTFKFQQAMRVDVLEGITDIGLRVQQHSK